MHRWPLQLICALILSGAVLGCSDDGAESSNGGDPGDPSRWALAPHLEEFGGPGL